MSGIVSFVIERRIYFGTKPFLLIMDLDMIRDVTVKQFDKFVDRLVRKVCVFLCLCVCVCVFVCMCTP